jgi:hypothetical protein
MADVFVVGGAAMVVAYDARPATRDVDGIWRPSAEVRAAAAQVAARHDNLAPDWLNDGSKGCPAATRASGRASEVGGHSGASAGQDQQGLRAGAGPAVGVVQGAGGQRHPVLGDLGGGVDADPLPRGGRARCTVRSTLANDQRSQSSTALTPLAAASTRCTGDGGSPATIAARSGHDHVQGGPLPVGHRQRRRLVWRGVDRPLETGRQHLPQPGDRDASGRVGRKRICLRT